MPGGHDPMRSVRELHALAAAGEEPVSTAELRQLIERAHPGGLAAAALDVPEQVTRGDCCRLLYHLTAPR